MQSSFVRIYFISVWKNSIFQYIKKKVLLRTFEVITYSGEYMFQVLNVHTIYTIHYILLTLPRKMIY